MSNFHNEIVIDMNYGGLNPVQFGYETCDPSHSFGPAVRTHWLLHYIVSGFGVFVRQGTTHRVGPGEIFVIPPYMETYYEADRDTPWKYIWIGFTTEDELPAILSQPVINCPGAGVPFQEMFHCQNMENGRSAFLSGCLWKLMGILLEQGKPVADYIHKAIHFMHAEYVHGITVKEIADRLNLDRSYFSTVFSQRMGASPQEYLINLRLTRAADLMITHGESPSTAAISVGYPDLYHFSKIFKKHFGLSPRAYIKNAEHTAPPKESPAEVHSTP